MLYLTLECFVSHEGVVENGVIVVTAVKMFISLLAMLSSSSSSSVSTTSEDCSLSKPESLV